MAKGVLSVYCETPSTVPLPEIMQQDLGHRPRLTSIDENEFNDKDSNESFESTDEPIICLNQLDISLYKNDKQKDLITKACNHEHDSIGFVPLSHTICTEGCSSFCCSDFSIENEGNFNPFEENQISEDAAISIYKLSCKKMNRVNIFEGFEDINLETLRMSLRRMQNTLDLL